MQLQRCGIRAWLCIPMGHAGRQTGFLTLEAISAERCWLDDDIALLRTAGEIFASAIEREQSEDEREALEARVHQAERLEAIGTLAGGVAHELQILRRHSRLLRKWGSKLLRKHDSRRVATWKQIMMAGEACAGDCGPDPGLQPPQRPAIPADRSESRCVRKPRSVARFAAVDAHHPFAPRGRPRRAHGRRHPASAGGDEPVHECLAGYRGAGRIDVTLDTIEGAAERNLSHGTLPAGRYIRLAVTDNGPGMDAAVMKRIFEPFFTTKGPGRGTGLGLASVHGIVTQHGGALNVRSRLGAGSTFETYFPQTEDVVRDERQGEAAAAPLGQGETVLFVDDETPLVALGEEMLALLGYEPVGFQDSAAALASFHADPQRFDLVLTDEVMPEMTGTELATELHRMRPDLPIILMTGYVESIPSRGLAAAGIREVLKKPLLSRPLATCVAKYLPAKQAAEHRTQ